MPDPTYPARRAQAAFLAALAEPTRLALVRALAAGEQSVTALAAAVGAEMVNVSHHLGVLRAAGVVTATKDGRFVRYALVGEAAGAAVELAHPSGLKAVVPLG